MNKMLLFCALAISANCAAAQHQTGLLPESSGRVLLSSGKHVFSGETAPATFNLSVTKSPTSKVGPSGSTIYAFMAYADTENFANGLVEICPDGTITPLWEYYYAATGAYMNSGWIRNGLFCGLGVYTLGSDELVADYAYQEMNLLTGELEVSRSIDVSTERLPHFSKAVYVPEDDRIYGFGREGDPNVSTVYVFKSAPADKPEEAVKITEILPGNRCYSLCWHPVDKCFYGINVWGKFVKIERDGTITELFETGIDNIATAPGALIYSPNDGYLLWSPTFYSDTVSRLFAIYPEENLIEELHVFDVDNQLSLFVTPDFKAAPEAPGAPVFAGADFPGPSLEGSLSFRLPEKSFAGESLTSELGYVLYANGKPIESGNGAPGSDLLIKTSVPEDAFYTFRLEASLDGKAGVPCVTHLYVGHDTPRTPAGVTLSDTHISWQPVSSGMHGGYLDTEAIEYDVYLNDRLVGSTKECSMPFSLDPDIELSTFYARVIARANGKKSEEGVSDKAILGRPLSLPVTIVPTPEQAELCTFINRDGSPDYGCWKYSEAWTDPCFSSGWSLEQPDDWLILPVTQLPSADVVYSVSVEAARGGMTSAREYFEVWAGPAPDPEMMTIPVIKKMRAQKFNEWVDYSGMFVVPEAGNYYVAVRAVSDPDQKDLIVKNIRITATTHSKNSPEAVNNLKVVKTSNPDLTATISFTMPQAYITGQPIPADVTVKAVAKGASTVDVEGKPGETCTLTVPTAQGDNYITVTPEIDGAAGRPNEVVVFTGMDMLGYVEDFRAVVSEDNMSVKLTWTPPVESLNGGYFATTGIKYYIGQLESDGSFTTDPVCAGTDITSYTLTFPKGTPQQMMRIGIAAENAAGLSYARSYSSQIIGTPYSMPVNETFDNCEVKYNPLVVTAPSAEYADGSWAWGQPELVNPDFAGSSTPYAIVGYTDAEKASVRMRLPKVSTAGKESAYATFELWTGNNCADPITILAFTYGMNTPEKIATVPLGEGWKVFSVKLPEKYLGRPWMNLYIDGKLASSEHFLVMPGYSIDETSGICDEVSDIRAIKVANGMISISGYMGQPYVISRVDGIVVEAGTCGMSTDIEVTAGVYIVKADTTTRSIMVR